MMILEKVQAVQRAYPNQNDQTLGLPELLASVVLHQSSIKRSDTTEQSTMTRGKRKAEGNHCTPALDRMTADVWTQPHNHQTADRLSGEQMPTNSTRTATPRRRKTRDASKVSKCCWWLAVSSTRMTAGLTRCTPK